MPEQPRRKVVRCVHDHVQEIVHARQAHERHFAAELKEEPHDERHECVVEGVQQGRAEFGSHPPGGEDHVADGHVEARAQ